MGVFLQDPVVCYEFIFKMQCETDTKQPTTFFFKMKSNDLIALSDSRHNEFNGSYLFHIGFHDRYPRAQLIYCSFGMY